MIRLKEGVPLALREKRSWVLPLGVWALVTLVTGLAGPFGTHAALDIAGRFAYWGAIVGLSVAGGTFLPGFDGRAPWSSLISWTGFIAVLSLLIWAINGQLFDSWRPVSMLGYLLVIVGLIVVAVHGLIWLINFARPAAAALPQTAPQTSAQTDPQTRFLRRLPLADRGPLVRIEAQDHYLNVVTDKGGSLILLRLSDAVRELSGTPGLLVHRSHWVALQGVVAHRRENGRDLLIMSDGVKVPVSRSNRAAARDAGLF